MILNAYNQDSEDINLCTIAKDFVYDSKHSTAISGVVLCRITNLMVTFSHIILLLILTSTHYPRVAQLPPL